MERICSGGSAIFMTGSFLVEIRNADVYYKFTVRRNITVLRGEGATGKTMLYRLVDTFNNVDSRGVSVRVDRGATVETLNRQRFSDGVLLNRTKQNRIFIIDENSDFVYSNEFAVQAQASGYYFILINRDKLDQISCSIHEIYQLQTTDTRMVTFKRIYPKVYYGTPKFYPNVLTEDSGAERQFFSRLSIASKVIPADGRSKIKSKLENISGPTLVIADGAALGFNIAEILESIKCSRGCLIAMESFEYVILKSGIVHSRDTRLQSLNNPDVDSVLYSSWERYYTALLCDLTKNTVLAYQKTHLTPEYSKYSNAIKILQAYGLYDVYSTVSSTSYF